MSRNEFYKSATEYTEWINEWELMKLINHIFR